MGATNFLAKVSWDMFISQDPPPGVSTKLTYPKNFYAKVEQK